MTELCPNPQSTMSCGVLLTLRLLITVTTAAGRDSLMHEQHLPHTFGLQSQTVLHDSPDRQPSSGDLRSSSQGLPASPSLGSLKTESHVLCVVCSVAVVLKVWPWTSTMGITWELRGASFSGPTHLLNQNPWEWSWVEYTFTSPLIVRQSC